MAFEPEVLAHQVVIPSDLRAARQLEEQLLSMAASLGYRQEATFALRLAMEEAIVNAHRHGNAGDPTKHITISYEITRKRAVIRVRDEGPGFVPCTIPDPTTPDRLSLPCGRGIMLMRSYLDSLTYSERGNEVELVKENR